jgi:hypothetical protein
LSGGGDAHADFDFQFTFGSTGAGNGQFNVPRGIAVNSTHIFVADTQNNRVQIFDLSGNFADTFGSAGAGNGQFDIPTGITVNATHIFVTEIGNDRVQIFDLSGNFVDTFGSLGAGNGQFTNPDGIAVNSNNIFVVDGGNDRVQIFDLSGNFVDTFGSAGAGNGQFGNPSGIAVNSNNIFVTEVGNDRVQIFDLSGNFVDTFGSAGAGNGQFTNPRGIAVNSNNIFVVDSTNNRVQIFDLSGNFADTFGSLGAGNGQFSSPRDIAVNSNNIFVTEVSNNRVQVFALSQSSENSDSNGGGKCRGDCTPPTLGLDEDTRRLVTGGFSYNANPVDVERYYTPYPLITVQTGKNNTATFKIYENMGPDNIEHFELAFGLAQGQILADSRASILWDRTFDGVETVTLNDPQNALDNVNVTSSAGPCDGGTIPCLILTIRHTFREQLEFDIVATNVWDSSRNAWQNYYNHGIHVEGESLNPPDTYTGIYRGHTYHLTETGKHAAVDEFGNTWSYEYGTWSMDYVPAPRPQDGDWQVLTRYHSGFEEYKKNQAVLAQKTINEILGNRSIQSELPTYVARPEPGADKRQTEEFYKWLASERMRIHSMYGIPNE